MRAAALRISIVALAWLGLQGSSCQQGTVRQVETVASERLLYVPIPPQLTGAHPIAEGEVWECHHVAAQRKEQLEACNADKAEISRIQGTRVEGHDQ